MDEAKHIWEQQPNEPNEAYARFLIYRNLGVSRSLEVAYNSQYARKRKKTQSISGTWTSDAATYDWINRASAWDIENLETSGRNAVVAFVSALEKLALKTIEALDDSKNKPKDWQQILSAVNILGSFIPAETVEAIRAHASEHRISAIGHTATGA